MTNLLRHISLGALIIAGSVGGNANAQQGAKPQITRLAPTRDMNTGVPRVSVRPIMKVGPTIVPVIDSNAMLNLDYKEMRATPAMAVKPAAPVAKPVVKEPTLTELKLQLQNAQQEYKASKLAYTQAVRSKDKTRVANARVARNDASAKVTNLKKAVAAKQPAVRKAPKKSTGGAKRTSAKVITS